MGEGGFGKVFLAIDRKTMNKYAIKTFYSKSDYEEEKRFMNETLKTKFSKPED